ncbi:MAG: ribonuclease HI [Planctomycetota bacterium]
MSMAPFPIGDPNSRADSDYLLYVRAYASSVLRGQWQFSLETYAGQTVLDAQDDDEGDLNRLNLLALVRGLEAIDGPASVTVLSSSRYLVRSMVDSLPRWRSNRFVWEHFGRKVPIQFGSLWKRVDHAFSIHRVEACLVQSRMVPSPSDTQPPSDMQTSDMQTSDMQTSDMQTDRIMRIDAAHPATPATKRSDNEASEKQGRDPFRRMLALSREGARRNGRRFTAADLRVAPDLRPTPDSA